MESNMHSTTSIDMHVIVNIECMVTTQTSSYQPPLGRGRPRCPSSGMKENFVELILRKHTWIRV